MAVVLLELGQDVHLTGMPLADAVNDGVRRAYADGYFRKSICDPLTRVNTGDNTPAAPAHGDRSRRGGERHLPAQGLRQRKHEQAVHAHPLRGSRGDRQCDRGDGAPCRFAPLPARLCGRGDRRAFDSCAFLAKKALTRDVGTRNARTDVASIEEEALEKINALGIGAQGFGGRVTALGVACEIAPTHIAGLPVAVNIQCHCIRCEKESL